jgi:hypothetical protein
MMKHVFNYLIREKTKTLQRKNDLGLGNRHFHVCVTECTYAGQVRLHKNSFGKHDCSNLMVFSEIIWFFWTLKTVSQHVTSSVMLTPLNSLLLKEVT